VVWLARRLRARSSSATRASSRRTCAAVGSGTEPQGAAASPASVAAVPPGGSGWSATATRQSQEHDSVAGAGRRCATHRCPRSRTEGDGTPGWEAPARVDNDFHVGNRLPARHAGWDGIGGTKASVRLATRPAANRRPQRTETFESLVPCAESCRPRPKVVKVRTRPRGLRLVIHRLVGCWRAGRAAARQAPPPATCAQAKGPRAEGALLSPWPSALGSRRPDCSKERSAPWPV
jgi:hypothetical protein